jgi:hypothetical protein
LGLAQPKKLETRTMAQRIDEGPDFDRYPLQSVTSLDYVIGASSKGEEISLPIEVIVGRRREPRLVAVAGVHGDEIDGIAALQDAWRMVDPTELRGTLLVVPVANPPAMEAGTRCGPEDGLDMNRIFPGDGHGTVTQRLAHHLFHDVVLGADLLATFHGWFSAGVILPYTEFPGGVGDVAVEERSLEAGRAFGLGLLRVLPYKPGRLLPEAVRSGIPTIESEIGGLGIGVEEHWRRYREGLFDLLRFMHMLPGDVEERHPPLIVRSREVLSPVRGLLRHQVGLGARVDESQVMAMVNDAHGRTAATIRAPLRALVAGQRRRPFVETGERICTLFQEIEDYPEPAGA